MLKVKSLAVMTRPELEQAMEQMNVTRRDMHKLIELQHERITELREALACALSFATKKGRDAAAKILQRTEPRP